MFETLATRPRIVSLSRRLGVVPDAWRFALPLLAIGIPALLLPPLGIALLASGISVLLFFRDPDRTPPPAGIVSPADGTVSVVRPEGDRFRVGVFMNVTDVHVNRAPADGVVRTVTYRPGAHRPAFSKDSDRNERVDVDCGAYELSLIAGAFARRITTYVESDERVDRGQRVGHIAFGSRADVLLPPSIERADLRVTTGQTVRAGETVIAEPPAESAESE